MKISRNTLIVATIVIVAILVVGLVAGLGIIQFRGGTTTDIVTTTQTITETQAAVQPVMETIVSTASPSQSTVTDTATATSIQISQTTLRIPTTASVNVTKIQTVTSYTTTVQNVTTTASGYVDLLPSGSWINFTSGEMFYAVTQASLRVGFNGFFVINYETVNATAVHWVLEGNSINETSNSEPSGGVEFPVQAYVPYSLLVFNDECTTFVCNNAFNMTVSITYQY